MLNFKIQDENLIRELEIEEMNLRTFLFSGENFYKKAISNSIQFKSEKDDIYVTIKC